MSITLERHLVASDRRAALEQDVRLGLSATPKSLSPTWLYDERGSVLFDQITELAEYYPTRTERSILIARAEEIVELASCDTLVELGSGTSDKTRLILAAMSMSPKPLRTFIPLDVSEEILVESAEAIQREFDIRVHAIVGDFHGHLSAVPPEGHRLFAFLGSTIGNLDPAARQRFFVDLDAAMDHSDRLLLGTDLRKDPARLIAAYDDKEGVTAAFNRNVLHVLNAELGANFVPERFDHVARWNEADGRIEMWLRASKDEVIEFSALGFTVRFQQGEELLTEISTKFTVGQVNAELSAGGFVPEQTWTDEAGDFLLTLARPYC